MKKHKCKVCKKSVKQKKGPGRPKTMHDRCKNKKAKKAKKTKKAKKSKKSKKATKKKTKKKAIKKKSKKKKIKRRLRRNPPIGAHRPGGSPRPDEAKYCQHLVTDEITGITEPCRIITRGGKPFCQKHIGQGSYIQDLMERLAGKQYEEAVAEERGTKKLEEYLEERQIISSLTMEELLLILKLQGSRTVNLLAIEMNVSKKIAETYVALLKKRGKVKTYKNKRGAIVVRLPEKRKLRRRNPWRSRFFSQYSPIRYSQKSRLCWRMPW